MIQTTFSEFRQHAAAYFDEVEKGNTVKISRHGKIVAELVPTRKSKKSWKKPGIKLPIKGVSLSKIILEERESD